MVDDSINERDLIRSLLSSDNDLQIRPSGDINQISIRLQNGVSLNFFHDPITLLTINNAQDLRISKVATRECLKHDVWIDLKSYFTELINDAMNSNLSIYRLVELLQDRSSQSEQNLHTTVCLSKSNASTSVEKFRGADHIYHRIAHDTKIDPASVLIGYEDRFLGVQEVPFNDFQKVHDNERGIPMHRIRHFKANGSIVWDRTKKYDILTGGELHNQVITDTEEAPDLTEGLYCFNKLTQKWDLCTHNSLESDNPNIPMTENTLIPKICQFVTWNILFDYLQSISIYSDQRYEQILKTLKSVLPDVICLQEVTIDFLHRLLEERWIRENNYYIIIMGCILDRTQSQPYGQLTLTKNFRPRAFSICPLPTSDESLQTKGNFMKQYIIARFALSSKVTIDLVNLHLRSSCKEDSAEKRCKSLEHFFKTLKTQNYMLIGDFNFGDCSIAEQHVIRKYKYEIHDLWSKFYDLDENPGCTFDPSRNTCAQITSTFPQPLRVDRYLLHPLLNLSYSIEHINMVGLETIIIDSTNRKYLNQSDHYGLQSIIHFRIRPINQHAALVLLPTEHVWHEIELLRKRYDPFNNQWLPHITLLRPFFNLLDIEDDEERILLPLRLHLADYAPFEIELDEIDFCKEDCSIVLTLNESSVNYVKVLYQQIKQLFPQRLFDDESDYYPHMTIANFETKKKRNQLQQSLNKSIKFSVHYVYLLRQASDDGTAPLHVTHQIPLGAALEPVELSQFYKRDLPLQNVYKRKQNAFNRLSSCFEKIFNANTTHHFSYALYSYGSFRLGLHGDDLDVVLVFYEQKTTADQTDLDRMLFRTRYDQLVLYDQISNLVKSHFARDEIIECRVIDALYPIISLMFQDQCQVDIYVQIKGKIDKKHILSNFYESIHGVHDIERLITYVRIPSIFQQLLTFIRSWAQCVGIYGQVYGYLGGYSWAILTAYICHKFISLTNFPTFSTEQFGVLIEKFFAVYAEFDWSLKSLSLYPINYHSTSTTSSKCKYTHGSMQILCPSPPNNNSARSTTNSTRYLIVQNFKNAHAIIKKTTVKPEETLKDLLNLPNQFPDKTIGSVLQLKLSSRTIQELNRWISYTKSRLGHFLGDCECRCSLFVQTDSRVEQRNENLERFYSIGFQMNVHTLSTDRQFKHCLNQFLSQCAEYPLRTDTMKLSYKLMPIEDWKIEQCKCFI